MLTCSGHYSRADAHAKTTTKLVHGADGLVGWAIHLSIHIRIAVPQAAYSIGCQRDIENVMCGVAQQYVF